MNKVFLIGHVGTDPETITMQNGEITKVRLATKEFYRDDKGARQSITFWHNLIFKNNLSEAAATMIKKGMKIGIEGAIRYREIEKDGAKQRFTDIMVFDFELPAKESE
jgi:single-strand DNA-binding protein